MLKHSYQQIKNYRMITQLQKGNNSLEKQSPKCKVFEENYESKQKLGVFEAHVIWMVNQYHPQKNPDGIVNFGTSVNAVISKTTVKYLPEFIKNEDCPYVDPRGFDEQFNKKVCERTPFAWDETFTFNNVYSILSLFCHKYKNVFLIGNSGKINFDIILDHSQSILVDSQQKADLLVIFQQTAEAIKKIQQKSSKSIKLYILNSKQQLNNFDVKKQNQAFIFEFSLKQKINLAAVVTKGLNVKKAINEQWIFYPTSTVTRKASLTPNLTIQIKQTGKNTIRKMIQIDSNAIVPEQNIWFTLGATSALDTISRVIFKNVNICVDSPYYSGFDDDLTHNGARIIHKPLNRENLLIDLIKQSQSQGFAGFIICNPKNPVGTILAPQQVDQICNWAKDKPNFQLIFDEIYLNTSFGKNTKSAASYAVKMPNIHVARGMAKDFGLCGLKIGFCISSNPTVMKKFQQWKPIISHHPYTISVINSMIKKSNYGTEIITYGKKLLKNYFDTIYSELDKGNITYIKPQAGCFVYANFKDFMDGYSLDQQVQLWKKLFYKYRVNLSNGANYHTPQHGYFRICPIIEKEIMKQGLRRIIAGLKDRQVQEHSCQLI